jgi:transposase InsO family protein
MPWKEIDAMESKLRFALEYERGEFSMAELCRQAGISRPTGYAVLRRFAESGIEGLAQLSRAPLRHPNQTLAEIEDRILQLRREHATWGPKKLHAYLQRKYPRTEWPAISTMGELVARAGLTVPRKKRRRVPPYSDPFVSVFGPNQTWCIDFKGWFKAGDGERIDPFTITDAHSRYLLRCQAVNKGNTEQVCGVLSAGFREYGMPLAIRSDNGAPFASRAIAGLSRVAVYLMKLGIVPERIEAGHPEQNGRHERMHRTLKAETASPPAPDRRSQQKAFDRFRREYNQERPHEALQQRTPAECYAASPRRYPERVPEPEYDSRFQVRRVQAHGEFCWKHHPVFLSETLAGEAVGLEPLDNRYYQIYFAKFPVGRFDSHSRQVEPLKKTIVEPTAS